MHLSLCPPLLATLCICTSNLPASICDIPNPHIALVDRDGHKLSLKLFIVARFTVQSLGRKYMSIGKVQNEFLPLTITIAPLRCISVSNEFFCSIVHGMGNRFRDCLRFLECSIVIEVRIVIGRISNHDLTSCPETSSILIFIHILGHPSQVHGKTNEIPIVCDILLDPFHVPDTVDRHFSIPFWVDSINVNNV